MIETRETVLSIRGLTKHFGAERARVDVLRGVDLEVGSGEFVAIMGPSGSGKSTLLHLIGGLEPASAGVAEVSGRALDSLDDDALTLLRRREIGFVFQYFNLIDVLTAEENVALPLTIESIADDEAFDRARQLLEVVGLAGRESHLPGELSGGEQQRVAIARALVAEPRLVLADEPTGNLDTETSSQVLRLLRGLVDKRGQTVLMVTHDARCASVADRVIRLIDGLIVEDQSFTRPPPLGDVLDGLEGGETS